jgi:hypothetical protein
VHVWIGKELMKNFEVDHYYYVGYSSLTFLSIINFSAVGTSSL